jgi:ribokinase
MNRIAVVGSANLDFVVTVPHLPTPGETIGGGEFAIYTGGKGANQAAAIGRLGGDVSLIAKVGNDDFGSQLRGSLEASGVNLNHLASSNTIATGVASIFVDSAGSNMIAVAPGSNLGLTPQEVTDALSAIRPDVILCQLEIPLSCAVAAAEIPGSFILNPAPAVRLSQSLLSRCDVITPNEVEAEQLTGLKVEGPADCEAAASRLLEMGAKAVVITLGPRGAYYQDPSRSFHRAAFKVEAVDTTGAGDAFNGALALYLPLGVEEAILRASAVAAISVTRRGAQASMPRASELDEFLRSA